MNGLRQLFVIARNTFTEAVRQPVYAVLILVGSLGLVLNVALAAYSMQPGEGDNQELVLLGLSMLLVMGTLLAGATAPTVLSDEIESKTVLTVVSKPVARPVFVIGKYLGVVAAITLAYFILALVFLLTVRHGVLQNASDRFDGPVWAFGAGFGVLAILYAALANYLYRKVFMSAMVYGLAIALAVGYGLTLLLGKGFVPQSPVHALTDHEGRTIELMVGLVMLLQAIWVLTAVAVAVSTRTGALGTILISAGVFVVGLVSHGVSGWVNDRLSLPQDVSVFTSIAAIVGADLSPAEQGVYLLAKGVFLIVPNLQFFWPADALTQGNSLIRDFSGALVLGPVLSVITYGLAYTAALLAVAVALFQRREVG